MSADLPDPRRVRLSRGLRWQRSGHPVRLQRYVGQDECTGDLGMCAHCDRRRRDESVRLGGHRRTTRPATAGREDDVA